MPPIRTQRAPLAIALLAAALLFGGLGCKGESAEVREASKPFTLKYWRVVDDVDAFDTTLEKYRALHPNISIEYRKFRIEEYERALLDALAQDEGPDVMSIHNTWLRRWQSRLLPVPPVMNVAYQEVRGAIKKELVTVIRQVPGITVRTLAAEFVPAVVDDVVIPTEQEDPRAPLVPRIYGLPLSVDSLVLYYNRDILNESGVPQPARYWPDFQEQVKAVTQLDEVGTIVRSAAAIGTADNVERASDILALLMMQNGAPMADANGVATFDRYPPERSARPFPPGAEALIFYTDFANPTKEVYTWNKNMPGSLEAFVAGQTAYFFGYSYHLPQIRLLNPKLNVGIAPFPQLENNAPLNNANYWVETVSNKTAHPAEAWEFVQFVTAADQAKDYLAKAKVPAARTALAESQINDLNLGVFASQAPTTRSWYKGTDADAVEAAFEEMIRQALAEEADPVKIVELGATKVNQTIE